MAKALEANVSEQLMEKPSKMEAPTKGLIQATVISSPMEEQLAPAAAGLRKAAKFLLFFSVLRLFSPGGLFGLISACTILCCAAPGPLGTAYASRFARTTSKLSAIFAMCAIAFIAAMGTSGCRYAHITQACEHAMEHSHGAMDAMIPYLGVEPPPAVGDSPALQVSLDLAHLTKNDGKVGGLGGLGPAWTRGEKEAPKGEKNMGSWTAAVYTAEQQFRLGLDEMGTEKGYQPPVTLGANDMNGVVSMLQAPHLLGADGHGLLADAAKDTPHAFGAGGHGQFMPHLHQSETAAKTLGADGHGILQPTEPKHEQLLMGRRLHEHHEHDEHGSPHEHGPPAALHDATCKAVAAKVSRIVPFLLAVWALAEAALVVAAIVTAKRAFRIMHLARGLGAIAI